VDACVKAGLPCSEIEECTCHCRQNLQRPRLTTCSSPAPAAAPLLLLPLSAAGHQQGECPKKAIDVYRLPDQLQSKVDEMYAKVSGCAPALPSIACLPAWWAEQDGAPAAAWAARLEH